MPITVAGLITIWDWDQLKYFICIVSESINLHGSSETLWNFGTPCIIGGLPTPSHQLKCFIARWTAIKKVSLFKGGRFGRGGFVTKRSSQGKPIDWREENLCSRRLAHLLTNYERVVFPFKTPACIYVTTCIRIRVAGTWSWNDKLSPIIECLHDECRTSSGWRVECVHDDEVEGQWRWRIECVHDDEVDGRWRWRWRGRAHQDKKQAPITLCPM